jgi:hypothetical protein
MMQRVSIDTAGELLDFSAGGRGPVSGQAAQEQLAGAVAVHNILADEGVAYLADEVGMGKTYVALGAMALLRHFQPEARVLVLAPRENIQKKWLKELRNFVGGNVRFPDLRVKAVHEAPARSPVFCGRLQELVHETILDPDRDFFARMTSFSLSLGKDTESWKRARDEILKHLPWVDHRLFDLRSRDRFKENIGRALNAALPRFDLVIVDEGHNLKHGLGSGTSTRNQLMSLAFGHPDGCDDFRAWPTYGPRAERVLFLSATPLEDDFRHLWNQLDVFGKAGPFEALLDHASPAVQRDCARRFLIRRVFALHLDGDRLTKNLYRREWRQGGVERHDNPIEVVDPKQQLVVALVQKKVSELLGHEKFNNSFQVGMLASFESFLQTAGVASGEEVTVFDDAEQAIDLAERQGLDVHAVNSMAADYRRRFGQELPHPKMDAMVERLAHAFVTGEKSLIFVRRVASVSELKRKLNERYDAWIIEYLRGALKPELLPDFERAVGAYASHRLAGVRQRDGDSSGELIAEEDGDLHDTGGNDSFFAWFFRGQSPVPGLLSGGQFALRFNSAGAMLGTFFEDNHVAAVLGVPPGGVTEELSRVTGLPAQDVTGSLQESAGRRLPTVRKQQRGTVFLAYQAAALALLVERADAETADRARIVLEERFGDIPEHEANAAAPALDQRLETRTFWTELRRRDALRDALWGADAPIGSREQFRELELRRELLSSMARLGHPLIDLYSSAVNATGTLTMGRASEDSEVDDTRLIEAYLDTLDLQRIEGTAWTGFSELKAAADHFDMILMTNEPEVRRAPLGQASRLFGRLLRAQEPVGGMSGQVNETLVRQFRMPGYPLVLVTTELLKEGEDLHTFCANVVHYGIAWMPSATEQRIGRIDRVSSLSERRLLGDGTAAPDRKLQVFYPYLRDTVERVQVERVMRRQHEFLRLLHEGFGSVRAERTVNLAREAGRAADPLMPVLEPLTTAYPVVPDMLAAEPRKLAVGPDRATRLHGRFGALELELNARLGPIEWEPAQPPGALIGTRPLESRVQPFTLLLRSTGGAPLVRCVSPVGFYPGLSEWAEELLRMATRRGVRVCATADTRLASYNLSVEGDVLIDEDGVHDAERVASLVERVTSAADEVERLLFDVDQGITTFRATLRTEGDVDR